MKKIICLFLMSSCFISGLSSCKETIANSEITNSEITYIYDSVMIRDEQKIVENSDVYYLRRGNKHRSENILY